MVTWIQTKGETKDMKHDIALTLKNVYLLKLEEKLFYILHSKI